MLLVIGGLLITIGGAMGPETRDVDMAETPTEAPGAEREPRFTREPAAKPSTPATTGVAMSREDRVR